MKTNDPDLCVICGIRPKTGRDHIPPKSIFPQPRPSDLITVPACDRCNNRLSGLDEQFKVFIGIQAGHGSTGEKLFRDQTSRTILHNRRLKIDLASTLREVEILTPEGIVLGNASAVLLKSKSYDTVIERIIRGLHFHHTRHILGDRVDIKVNWHRYLTHRIYEKTSTWPTGVVGAGQFIYKYAYFDEEPFASVWVLQFFGRAWSSGTVMPKMMPAK
jgi:hypothetical protein